MRFLLLCFVGILSFSFAAVSKESEQSDYELTFKLFRDNLNHYNHFIKTKCYNTSFQSECFDYMDRVSLITDDKEQFLDLVNLLGSPFEEDARQFKKKFKPNNKKINLYMRLVTQSLLGLSTSLSYLVGGSQDTKNIKNLDLLLELNRILIAFHGSINDTLTKQQRLRW